MSVEKISKRYAKAIFDEAVSTATLDVVYTDLDFIKRTLKESRELRAVFKSPVIKEHKKLIIASQIFSDKISSVTEQFLNLLINQSREMYLPEIIDSFFRLYNENKGISEVTVTSATELDEANEQKIISFIKSQSGYPDVKINKKVDPSIIGGFIVDFGGKLYDNSIRYKLSKVTKELTLN
ncbi:MAG: F0F2-type synthase subunit delta [Bacteroidota bacterium]|nr:F0F2-type synthase subunit delta [Bacteroidota bacterium]